MNRNECDVHHRSLLVYLATPYSHPDADVRERRFHEVNRVAGDLIRKGIHVFSPISHSHSIAMDGDLPKDFEFWQAYCRVMLRACGKMIVLMQDGWKESVGVKAEVAIAREMGLPVEFLEHNAEARCRAVASTEQPLVGGSIEDFARAKWDADADEYNQWDSIGQDEKDELIANVTNQTSNGAR